MNFAYIKKMSRATSVREDKSDGEMTPEKFPDTQMCRINGILCRIPLVKISIETCIIAN